MSPQELQALREEIAAKVPHGVVASRDTVAIAAALSEGRTRVATTPTRVGKGSILATLGMEVGNTFLDVVCSDEPGSPFRHARDVVLAGTMDLTMPFVRDMVQGLVAESVLSQSQADALCALGEEPAPVDEFDVRCACWSDGGEWLL